MTNYDLPAALKKYRLDHKLSLSQMGKKLNMSKSAYNRLEKGLRDPYHTELVDIIEKLELNFDPKDVPSIPKPSPKWYQSKKWNWLTPIAIAYLVLSMFVEQRGFREGFGEDGIAAGNHVVPLFIIGAVFCAIYWYFRTPEWPKRKPTRKEMIYGFTGTAVFLMLSFHEELIQWIGPYFPEISAGPWIVLALIATLLSLCFWTFKKNIIFSIRNILIKR